MSESNVPPDVPFTPELPLPRPTDTARRLRAESVALRQRAVDLRQAAETLREAFTAALAQLEPRVAARAVALAEVREGRARLHDEATRLAALLRAGGAAPEAMIVEVKSVIAAAAPSVWGARREALAADVVRWSIEAFYAA